MRKQYTGYVRDHSRSMFHLTREAAKDYNANLVALQNAARETGLDTILYVVKCGVGWDAKVVRDVVNSNVYVVEPLDENKYEASGSGTPLFDSVNEIISLMESVPDAKDPNVTFLVMVTTDGEENRSSLGAKDRMLQNFKRLQATDRWTFVFRVPRGYASTLARFGVPFGNIMEWDQTTKGMEQATEITTSAVTSYMRNVSKGVTSTGKFYADLSGVTTNTIKAELKDISYQVLTWTVPSWEDGVAIKDYATGLTGSYTLGDWYYELTKTEKVQDSKKIIIQDNKTGRMYTGPSARSLLGLPAYGEVKLIPGNLGNYKVFIQSTSVNRKLVGNKMVACYKG